MFAFLLAFLSSMFWPHLPSISAMVLIALIGMFCLHLRTKAWISGLILGFLWASSVGHWYSSWQLPNRYFNENIVVEGTVQSLQITLNMQSQSNTFKDTLVYANASTNANSPKAFIIKLSKAGKNYLFYSPKVRLSWFAGRIPFQEGDQVKLVVKLKRPHALANEGGFNRQKWLASQNIIGVGNVRESPTNQILRKNSSLRQDIVNRFVEYSAQSQITNSRWVLALSLGERSLLNTSDWQLLQTTGTAHLFAISGLHLGIVSMLFFKCAKVLLLATRIIKHNKQANIMPSALIVSSLFCIFYAYISGFQVPVLRALIALILVSCIFLWQAQWRPITVLLYLFVSFLLLFPLSILSISFWFSFGAIFIIYFYMWRFPVKGGSSHASKSKLNSVVVATKQVLGLQLFLSVAIMPFVIMNFGIISTVSVLVNLIVMPVLSLLFVPLCLLLVVFLLFDATDLTLALMRLLDWLFQQLVSFMQVFSDVEFARLEVSDLSWVTFPLLYVFMVLLFIPVWPRKKRLLVCVGALCIGVNQRHHAPSESWSVRVLDIGQGLSILVQQGEQIILYDTGQSFQSGASYASSVIAPRLLGQSADPSIDYLVNSHMDNDHAGGNAYIFSHFNVTRWLSPANGCNAKNSFEWGHLQVSILWPRDTVSGDANNHSCVIKISDGRYSVLLTGDIEKEAEHALLQNDITLNALQADVMLVPHHGSKTSSSLAFVKSVEPKYAVISSQYKNQWGFPHTSVLANYAKVNARIYNTAYDGEVVFTFSSSGIHKKAYRQGFWAPWYIKIY